MTTVAGAPFPPELPPTSEIFLDYWERVPFSLALREVHRLVALGQVLADRPPTQTILDVGVGDGAWWRYLKGQQRVYGVDISNRELTLARGHIDDVALVDISAPDAPTRFEERGWPHQFDGVIANCSLEHIPNLEGALRNIQRLVAPGGWVVMFVPTPWWAMQGVTQGMLAKRAPRLAMTVSGAMNGFFQHWHLMDRPTWGHVLAGVGLPVERVLPLGNRRTEFLFRLGLPSSLLGFVGKQVAGHYPRRLSPRALRHPVAERVAGLIDDRRDMTDADAYEFAIRCRRAER